MSMHPGDGEVYGSDLVPLTGEVIAGQVDELGRAERKAFDEYRRMGFGPAEALRLARAGETSWVRVERALLGGCSLEQALEIWT